MHTTIKISKERELMNNTDDIISLLLAIKNRPGVFIGFRSITKMKSFIDGYLFYLKINKIEIHNDIYNDFNVWLERKYNVKRVIDWNFYLIEETNHERKAFELFFKELDIYLQEKNIRIQALHIKNA